MADKILNIHEAKTHLSRHLANLQPGERIVVCKRNRPVAEVRLLQEDTPLPRRLGLAKGEFTVPDSFFEELPEPILDAFEGKG